MDIKDDLGWPYWSVDIPGLNEKQAKDLLTFADRAGIGIGGTAVNPAAFLTLHLDKETVTSILHVLNDVRAKSSLDTQEVLTISGLSEILKEWIDKMR